jgi:hypothetical protein
MNAQDAASAAPAPAPAALSQETPPAEAAAATAPGRAACANCGTVLLGKYCHDCSQSSAPTSFSVKEALQDFIYMMLKVDSKFVRALKVLVTAPGRLSLDHKNGIVVRYVKPLRLIFVVSLIISVLFAVADIKMVQQTLTFTPDARVVRDADGYPALQGAKEDILGTRRTVHRQAPPPEFMASLERELAANNTWMEQRQLRLWKALITGDPMRDLWSKGMPFLLLAVSPLFAAFLMLFFRRPGYMYVDHLVFALHVNTFFLLTNLLSAALAFVSPAAAELNLELAVMAAYLVLACRTFYGATWTAAALKGVTLAALDLGLFFLGAIAVYLGTFAIV